MERLIFEDPKLAAQLFGPQNLHLHILTRASGARLFNRGSTLCIESQDADGKTAWYGCSARSMTSSDRGWALTVRPLKGISNF